MGCVYLKRSWHSILSPLILNPTVMHLHPLQQCLHPLKLTKMVWPLEWIKGTFTLQFSVDNLLCRLIIICMKELNGEYDMVDSKAQPS